MAAPLIEFGSILADHFFDLLDANGLVYNYDQKILQTKFGDFPFDAIIELRDSEEVCSFCPDDIPIATIRIRVEIISILSGADWTLYLTPQQIARVYTGSAGLIERWEKVISPKELKIETHHGRDSQLAPADGLLIRGDNKLDFMTGMYLDLQTENYGEFITLSPVRRSTPSASGADDLLNDYHTLISELGAQALEFQKNELVVYSN